LVKTKTPLVFLACVEALLFCAAPCVVLPSEHDTQHTFDQRQDYDKLPPGVIPFEQFATDFALSETSTECLHPLTASLSQTMSKDLYAGLDLLVQVDEGVIPGLEAFIPIIQSQAPLLASKLRDGGRVFLVGAGSSGRVAIDIAAKCCAVFPELQQKVIGKLAGGDTAFIKPKEGFEDSKSDGKIALAHDCISPMDTVILISASGSCSFNVGCGTFAADQGATVFYFYNSRSIPSRTQELFDRIDHPAIPLCVDIGPQAIAGSTRLQSATVAEACLGSFLASALYIARGKEDLARAYPHELVRCMRAGLSLVKQHLRQIEQCVLQESAIFSNSRSNFRRLSDETDQGYVTFIASKDCMREILIDSTEIPPTFSISPVRRKIDAHMKRAEYQAYLVDQSDNYQAWHAVLGRPPYQEDINDANGFVLGMDENGLDSYRNRPKGKGNLVIGVAKLQANEVPPQGLLSALGASKRGGGLTLLLLMCREKMSEKRIRLFNRSADMLLVIEDIPYEPFGIAETLALKQILQLISNGSMILMNKVHGNQMIDVKASNNKLKGRCLRLIKGIWNEFDRQHTPTDRELYWYITHVLSQKTSYEDRGMYTPSIVKIILTMLANNWGPDHFVQAVHLLHDHNERVEELLENRRQK
jgi:N-acetylmuramic acid 6-phosphate etherase